MEREVRWKLWNIYFINIQFVAYFGSLFILIRIEYTSAAEWTWEITKNNSEPRGRRSEPDLQLDQEL